ncbi:MAG: single-stranded-DNA-specific exonuclease RecJ [Candidatus Magasanikbacteria bacterium]
MQKLWNVLEPAPETFLLEHPELPPAVANLLYHRNIRTQKQIDEFLNPDYSEDIHDPYLFRDMKKAVKRILKAIDKQEKIVVHGDYDADGVSASVILVSTLKVLGAKNTECFLPHRETDGYGLNTNTIQTLTETKTDLLITCDCGISNYDEVKLANKNNIDVIITDHHAVPDKLPPAVAIIHPQVKNEKYPDKNLAGGAVAFKLMQGLLKKHKEDNELLPNGETHEAFEKWLLDMVAIATVADMVSLTGESRTLTKYGLIVLNKTQRIGLQKLLLEARLLEENGKTKKEISTTTISFQIAPRINAAGRMNHANVAYNLLMTDDPNEATKLAYELDQNNQERQKMTEELVKRSIEQIENEQIDKPVLFVLGENWSAGIVGLIAGRIKERYYKPTIVMAQNNGEIMGSGRSIEGFNLIESLQEMPELFEKFGGHPMACGFGLRVIENLEDFKNNLIKKFNQKTKDIDIKPTLKIDAEVEIDNVDWDMYDVLKKFEPFGENNGKPKYLSRNLIVDKVYPVGKENKHLRIMVKSESGKIKKTIGWSLCSGNETNWCEELKAGDKIDIVFEIDVNEWNGNRKLQLTICDLKKSI